MNNQFQFRRGESTADVEKLKDHFSKIYFEGVGIFTEDLFHHFPGMKNAYSFLAEEKETGRVLSAFILMPWIWELEGVRLRISQMAGSATLKEYRRRGLVRELINCFDQTFTEEKFDLTVINGIGGFYRQFGFCYAIPVENHINLPLDLIPELPAKSGYTFRLADEGDIPYLMQEDESYRNYFSVATFRDEAAWKFLLRQRHNTVFGSEYWLMVHPERGEMFYCRIPGQSHFGGEGLLISEVSERIHDEALQHLFAFCKQKAEEGQKPFIRLNLHDESKAGKTAIAMGAERGGQMAWQIRIPDPAHFLKKITPVLEKRLQQSAFSEFTGILRLDFFKTQLDLCWEKGRLTNMSPGQEHQEHRFRIHTDLFPILCLGHRSWSDLARIRPDIGPTSEKSTLLIETLFPLQRSWLHEPA